MVENFKVLLQSKGLTDEKFYGLFGYYHVLQDEIGPRQSLPFAALLKKSLGLSVTSIVCLPLESTMYMPPNNQYPDVPNQQLSYFNADGPFFLVRGIGDLKASSDPDSLTLFRLNGKNSPYRQSNRLAGARSRIFGSDILPSLDESSATDYLQYVLLMRGSKALSKL